MKLPLVAELRLASYLALGVIAGACAPPAERSEPATPQRAPERDRVLSAAGDTWSPQPDGGAHALARLCTQSDVALARVAAETAGRLRDGSVAPEPSEVSLALRDHGAPYVWPRVWVLSGPRNEDAVRARFERWLASFGEGGERRCGVAVVGTSGDAEIVVAVAVDAMADLEPLPRALPVGSWIDVGARLLVQSGEAKVVVLGPRGAPRTLPTSLRAGRVSARFNADAPGEWSVQILAAPGGGPRPVLEATIHVGVDPERGKSAPAPGEDAARAGDDPVTALSRMVERTRSEHGLPMLPRDAELDAIAQAHAEHMQREGRVAHDLGAGDPAARVEALGRSVTRAGENVARADDLVRAHRALFRSPSHRANLLDPHFDAIGIGVARDERGAVWVCEVFARFAR